MWKDGIPMTDVGELSERVAQACRVIGQLDLTKAATGHLSTRVPGTDRVLIRARGPGETGVRYTSADEVITVDFDGNKLDGPDDLVPPREVFIHTWLYKTRPEVNAVVHAHPPTVVLFTICNKPLLPIYGGYDPSSLRLLLEGIPTYPRSVTVTRLPDARAWDHHLRRHHRRGVPDGDRAEYSRRHELPRLFAGRSRTDSR
jgi:ribulose-5-phosphate 4-epimerase/fuculose-1-phosphate aldolase